MIFEKQYFSEAEVWYILDLLVGVSMDLVNIQMPHDFICTNNLLVGKNGEIILLDDCALERSKVFDEEYQLPLSPDEIKSLNNPTFKVSRLKSIVWAIGLTTLSIATVTEIKAFYADKKINSEYLAQKLQKIQKLGFSPAFCEIIDACLKFQESERVSLDSLHKYFKGGFGEMKENRKNQGGGKRKKLMGASDLGETTFKVSRIPKRTDNEMMLSEIYA